MSKKHLAIILASALIMNTMPGSLIARAEGEQQTMDIKTVDTLPQGSERTTVSLNGTWGCATTPLITDPASEAVPQNFDNTISVPGLWDSAAQTLTGDYTKTALWFKTVVNFKSVPDKDSATKILLQIKKAQYGRYIYVNGRYAGNYLYNYSQSDTDITPFLKQGDNEIDIMLGSREQEKNDTNCPAHTGYDGERTTYYPGITDDVNLVMCASPQVTALQVAPNLQKFTIDALATLENHSSSAVTTDVTYNIYERGVYKDGVSSLRNKVTSYTEKNVTVQPSSSFKVSSKDIPVNGCDESKWWSPDNPYLYEVEVVTSGDTYTDRFGMRTFTFDPNTKLPMLNGKVTYLRGTNIAMNRFFEDPLRGNHPWDGQWARELLDQFKGISMNCLRMHLGDAPTVWYEAADEEGFLIDDQYAWWGNDDKGCTLDTLMPEFHSWIDERCDDPSIISWNIENEFTDAGNSTGAAIQKLRSYDISNRPWENGWNDPASPTDPCECHPYFFLNNKFTLSDLNNIPNTALKSSNRDVWNNNNPKINDEYGWLWLQRDGTPSGLSAGYYSKWMPNATKAQRKQFFADATGELTEYFREGRHYDAVMQFGGLIYSRPNGNTGDILSPDISTPVIRPEVKEDYQNAFAPLGVVIADYSESIESSVREKSIPVTVLNDYNTDVSNLNVNLTLYAGAEQIPVYSEKKTYNLKQAGDSSDRQQQTFDVKIPNAGYTNYTLIAKYTRDGKTVTSKRAWTVTAGGKALDRSAWKATSSTSVIEGNNPQNAFDGDSSTRWANCTGQTSGQSFQIDFGSAIRFDELKMTCGGDYPAKFSLYTSSDGTNWTPALSQAAGNSGTIDVKFPVCTARYLKITLDQPANPSFWWSIYELNLYLGATSTDIKEITQPGEIAVSKGTSFTDTLAKLPKTVPVLLEDGKTTENLNVDWDSSANPAYDGSTAGDYILTGKLELPTDGSVTNSSGLMALADLRVLAPAQSIAQVVNPDSVSVKYGTTLTNVVSQFPQTVTAQLPDGSFVKLGVNWNSTSSPAYNSKAPGTYTFTGTLTLPKDGSITNSSNLTAQIAVKLLAPPDIDPTALDRSGWTATGSSNDSNNAPAFAIDGDLSTRWSTCGAQSVGQHLTIDFGSAIQFNKINMVSQTDNPAAYSLAVSQDGKTWTTFQTNVAGSSGAMIDTFPTQNTRYLKITLSKVNNPTYWWSIYELNLYNVVIPTDIGQVTQPAALTVPYDTSADSVAAQLPKTVPVLLKDGKTTKDLPVVWNPASQPAYNSKAAGSYVFSGTFTLPSDNSVTNGDALTAQITVTVQPQPASSSQLVSSSQPVSSVPSSSSAASASIPISSSLPASSQSSSSQPVSSLPTPSETSSTLPDSSESAVPSTEGESAPSSQVPVSQPGSTAQPAASVPNTGDRSPVTAMVLLASSAVAAAFACKRRARR